MTNLDYCAQITIEISLATDAQVKIDGIFVTQDQLCRLDQENFMNDDVSILTSKSQFPQCH